MMMLLYSLHNWNLSYNIHCIVVLSGARSI